MDRYFITCRGDFAARSSCVVSNILMGMKYKSPKRFVATGSIQTGF